MTSLATYHDNVQSLRGCAIVVVGGKSTQSEDRTYTQKTFKFIDLKTGIEQTSPRFRLFADMKGPIMPHMDVKNAAKMDLGPKRPSVQLIIPKNDENFEFVHLIEKMCKAASYFFACEAMKEFKEILTFTVGDKTLHPIRNSDPAMLYDLCVVYKEDRKIEPFHEFQKRMLDTDLKQKIKNVGAFLDSIPKVATDKGYCIPDGNSYSKKTETLYFTLNIRNLSYPGGKRQFRKANAEIEHQNENNPQGWGFAIPELRKFQAKEGMKYGVIDGSNKVDPKKGETIPLVKQPGDKFFFHGRVCFVISDYTEKKGSPIPLNMTYLTDVWWINQPVKCTKQMTYDDDVITEDLVTAVFDIPSNATAAAVQGQSKAVTAASAAAASAAAAASSSSSPNASPERKQGEAGDI